MQSFKGVVIELNKNKVRALNYDLETKEESLDGTIASDSRISSPENFAKVLKNIVKSFKSKPDSIVFLIEEKDIFDRFFIVGNDEKDPAGNLKTQAADFVGESLDNFVTVFQKVSPFVFQFIGVQKKLIETYLRVSTMLPIPVKAILPVSLIFAKLPNERKPFFLIFKGVDDSTLVASEYGGVYFSGTYTSDAEVNGKMTNLIKDLSTFNREKPITDLYYLGEEIKIDTPYQLKKIDLGLDVDIVSFKGFERLLSVYSLLVKNLDETLSSYFNMWCLLTPSKASDGVKVSKLVPVVVAVFVIALGLGLVFVQKSISESKNTKNNDVNGVSESSVSAIPEGRTQESSGSALPLKKEDLSIRVENGAGIAGTASKGKTFLESFGYKVSEVGNAASFDFSETKVSIKKSKEKYLEMLISDLKKEYSVISDTDLAEDKSYDAVVIIGRK